MQKIILRLLYDGSLFHGFQRQPGLKTVEGEIEKILKKHGCIDGFRRPYYSASGRTDKGVHAFAQTISFYTNCNIDKIISVLGELEPEIHVWAHRVDHTGEFHPRYWALWREYIYVVKQEREREDEIETQNKTLIRRLLGCKDYSFLGLPKDVQSFHCIFKISMVKWNNSVVYHIVGSSFARQMIRRIISFIQLKNTPRRLKSLKPARPENLMLFNVRYGYSFKIINPKRLEEIIQYHARREAVFEYLYQNYVSQNAYWYDEFV